MRHRRNPTELAWQEYLEANRAKGAAIRQARRQCFEEAIENACKEEEIASGGCQNGLSKKVSFFPHHPQFLPLPPLRALSPSLKRSATPSKLASLLPFPLMSFQTFLSFNTPLKNPHPFQSHLKKLHLPSPKHAPTKLQAQRAYLCIFSSFWAGHFLIIYSPCSKLASIFLITLFISSNHPLLP